MSTTPAPAHPSRKVTPVYWVPPTRESQLPFDYLGARPTAEQVVDRDAAELRAND